jgi:hypothetical protein
MKILLIELETKGHHITSYLKSIINNLQENKQTQNEKQTKLYSLLEIINENHEF